MTKLSDVSATHVLFYQLAAAFVLLTAFAMLTGTAQVDPTALLMANLVFQAVVVSFFSFFIWFWLLTRYKASQLGVYSLVTPLFGVVLGYWFLGEPLTAEFSIGSVGVLIGIMTVTAYPWISRRLHIIGKAAWRMNGWHAGNAQGFESDRSGRQVRESSTKHDWLV